MGNWSGIFIRDKVSVIKIYRRHSPRIGAIYPHAGVAI